MGVGVKNGTTWTFSAATTGFSAGTYTYYSVATDTSGNSSNALSTALTVNAANKGTPAVAALTISPSVITPGGTTTLTASGAVEMNGSISSVSFYRESNGTTGLQTGTAGDTLVGTGTASGDTWTLANVSTTGLTAGAYTYYAIAFDSTSIFGAAATAGLTIIGTGAETTDLLGFDVSALPGGTGNFGPSPLTATTADASLSNTIGLTRGSGVVVTGNGAARCWGGANWSNTTAAAGVSANEFFTFGLTVASGYVDTLSAFDWNYRRSPTGPSGAELDYSINGGSYAAISTAIALSSATGGTIPEITLPSTLTNLAGGTTVTFRITPYGASSTSGSCYVYDTAATTDADLYLDGSAIPVANYPTVTFSTSNFTANESDGTATVTVIRTGATAAASTVQYLTSDGSATAGVDYTAASGTLTFNAGDTSKTFTIPLINSAAPAGTRLVNLALFNPGTGSQTGSQSVATLTVTDNIAPQFAFGSPTYSVNVNAGSITISVNRSANLAQTASVNFATSDGSAVAGVNYIGTSGTLNFAANQSTATFTVTIENVLVSTASTATVNLTLSGASLNASVASPSTAVLAIALNAAPTLSFSVAAYAANESDGTATITVTPHG